MVFTIFRPKPVVYSQQYIDAMEEEVNEISRAYVTDYWFDDVDKDVTDLLNSDEWETVPQGKINKLNKIINKIVCFFSF